MKFTFSWLKQHLQTNLSIDEIIDNLTNIGLEVENVENRSQELKEFSVAYVKNAEKHPNADRLKICEVETNKGTFMVVCGASNAKTGMKGIFAPVGSYIPGTGIILKKTDIRGIKSAGMLVSEKEMGISDEHEGIIEVDNKYKIGEQFAKIYGLDDPVIEIAITPNRGDCLAVRGIARDLSAAGVGKLKKINYPKNKGKFDSPILWKRSLDKKNQFLCPAVSGRFFRNVKNIESPEWLKKKLIAIGLRPISALVDITNFITFDLGRPLHVFDADKLKGNLTMRLARNHEKIQTLDGKSYNLSNEMVVIADNKQAHAIGGVMGGENSGCTEKTTNVFLEVAVFDPKSIAITGRKLDLQSDARYRFERGIDPYSIEIGIDAATEMILNLCGGEASKITGAGNYKVSNKICNYKFERLKTLGGIDIKKNKQKKILHDLGFKVIKEKKDQCNIKVPTYRPDIDGEADLVEEILRIYGYKNISPLSVLKEPHDLLETLQPSQLAYYKAKRLVASRGYFEVVTWSFMSSKIIKYFNQYNNILKLDNPISADLDIMRPTIIPNLLESIVKNQSRLIHNAGIFEVGPQYENLKPEGQHMMVSGIRYGTIHSANWNDQVRKSDVFDIKADVYYLLSSLSVPVQSLILEYKAPDWYHPGKSATIKLGNNIIGFIGEISPIVLDKYEIKVNVSAFEIFINSLSKFQIKKSSIKNLLDNNPYQAIERDFAFIVDIDVKSSEIVNCISKAEKKLIKDIKVFDIYEGQNIPDDKKSIAIRVTLQPEHSTFTDQEIETIAQNIIKLVDKETGGKIRK